MVRACHCFKPGKERGRREEGGKRANTKESKTMEERKSIRPPTPLADQGRVDLIKFHGGPKKWQIVKSLQVLRQYSSLSLDLRKFLQMLKICQLYVRVQSM